MPNLNETKMYELIKKLKANINLMGFDYDRLSSSGQELYDRILKILNQIDKINMPQNVDREIIESMANYMQTHLCCADRENIYNDLTNQDTICLATSDEIIKYFEKIVKKEL